MNPFDDEFWMQELRALFGVIFGFLKRAITGGVDSGYAQLPEDVTRGLSDDAIDAFVRQYALNTASGITQTSRRVVSDAIIGWRQSGEPLDALIAELTPMFGARRAEMIAVTEVTRAYAEGNIAAWRDSGLVEGKQWRTARDDLVCPICAPLDSMIVELEADGFTTEAGDLGLYAPPAHVNCRCGLSPVTVKQ